MNAMFFAKDESIERTLPVWQFQILLHVTLHHHDWPKNVCFLSFILNKMTKLFFVVSFISYKQTSHENITDLAFVWSQATITKSLNCAPIKHSIFWSEIKKKISFKENNCVAYYSESSSNDLQSTSINGYPCLLYFI